MDKINVRYAFAQSNDTINFFLADKPITSYAYILDLSCTPFSKILSSVKTHLNLDLFPKIFLLEFERKQLEDGLPMADSGTTK